jgi:hypothetical integral membrane protein (TIGR02206 family)
VSRLTYNTRVPQHPVYGFAHVTWIAGIIGASIALSLLCRRNLLPYRYVRIALICLLVGGELQRYATADIRFPGSLPLNLCNITTWVAVFACLTLSTLAVEFAYFAGIAGAGVALVTPDMGSALPSAFFLNHGAIIITACVLVYGRNLRLPARAVWRALGYFWLYVVLIGLFDWRFGVNYFFLCRKPGTVTVLDFFGPWPFYLLGGAALGQLLFWLLWLPVRPRNVAAENLQDQDGPIAISHAERS